MHWNNLKDKKPDEYIIVLVAQDFYDDADLEFFTASFWEEENTWMQHLHFPKESLSYVRIERKSKENDLWCYIEEPENKEI